MPEDAGFDAERLDKARALLEAAIRQGAFPGAVALVARRGKIVVDWALGHAQVEPVSRAMLPDAIFDLASLTKPVAGATTALLLLEEGVWNLDDAVARFIPEFGQDAKGGMTLRHLLTHTAGFAGWAPTYVHARDPDSVLAYLCGIELANEPGSVVEYSDLGMSLIGHLVRRVSGFSVDRLLEERVWRPLGMHDTSYNPPAELQPRLVATERGNRYEQVMVSSLGETFDEWRTDVLVGQVNDGNTYYPLGGVSTHAGMFSTARDLFVFAQMTLQGGSYGGVRILSPSSVAEAVLDQTAGLGQARGLGWQLLRKGRQVREEWAASEWARRVFPPTHFAFPSLRPYGDLLSGRTYGHTGFTGTSLAVDPERELVIVLLTNRIHPDANNSGIEYIRPRFHNLVAASLVD
jgi:CubicO group peptidase (beta-lactamase class C family)